MALPSALELASSSSVSEGLRACPQPRDLAVCVPRTPGGPAPCHSQQAQQQSLLPSPDGQAQPALHPSSQDSRAGSQCTPMCIYHFASWLLKTMASSKFPSSPVSSSFSCCLGSTNQLQGTLCPWLSPSLGQERALKINLGSASIPRALISTLVADSLWGPNCLFILAFGHSWPCCFPLAGEEWCFSISYSKK